jgi:geranylgeranyl diphosphate synthase type I
MQKIRTEINELLRAHLEEHPFWKQFAEKNPESFRAVRDSVLAPGKRLRPLFFCAACRDAGADPFPRLAPVALALELVHTFILIHDDIIDRSALRRGEPTLNVRIDRLLKKRPADGFRGSDAALVFGDLLYIQSVDCLMNAGAPAEQKNEAVRLFSQAALDTGRGALLEMQVAQSALEDLTLEQIENLYAFKTGRYTFALPLQLAAVFCGRSVPDLSGFGKHAGIAFQLANDLTELDAWIAGGPFPDDLRNGRRTWPQVYAGSETALRQPETLAAVRQAAERHAQKALAAVDTLPEVRRLLTSLLNAAG